MAQILVNEISENYTYSIVSSSFATVALPITAAWGPAYRPAADVYGSSASITDPTDAMLEDTNWLKFESNQAGLESFIATFRGPSSNYRLANDYSYQEALTLLSAGYDVLVCRVSNGAEATNSITIGSGTLNISAKYPGTFGNNIKAVLSKTVTNTTTGEDYWTLVLYIIDPTSMYATPAENITFKFGLDETIPSIDEIKSNLVKLSVTGTITDTTEFTTPVSVVLGSGDGVQKGTDYAKASETVIQHIDTYYYYPVGIMPSYEAGTYYTIANGTATELTSDDAIAEAWAQHKTIYMRTADTTAMAKVVSDYAFQLSKTRYLSTGVTAAGYSYGCGSLVAADQRGSLASTAYTNAWNIFNSSTDTTKADALAYMEWVYDSAFIVIQLLRNKLDYNPNRLYSPWDDQNTLAINGEQITNITDVVISPLHRIIMDTAFYSRCATGMLDFPRSLVRSLVYDETTENGGYAQMLSHITSQMSTDINANLQLYTTHSALFGPWAPYKLTGMSKQVAVSPSLIALLIHRAQLLNQATQYEWLLPDNRKHNLRIGEPDYKVPAKLRDSWQSIYGIGVNVIAAIPDLGINQWGNSTLFDVPPATYQALADLSTRWLVNAIEDIVYRTGISITFNYNNGQSYQKFYVGVTPLLDTMLNAGAIEDYKVQMSPDLDALGQVKARSVIGTIALVVSGVINDITVDLIALPPGTDLSAFNR